MKLIEKNTFGDDTFYILEMEDQDKEAISDPSPLSEIARIATNGLLKA